MQHVYVFVRTDLPAPYQAVQATHAAIVAARDGIIPKDCIHPSLVLIGVPDTNSLCRVMSMLTDHNVEYRAFVEADLGHQLTAIATRPVHQKERRLFREYKLLK